MRQLLHPNVANLDPCPANAGARFVYRSTPLKAEVAASRATKDQQNNRPTSPKYPQRPPPGLPARQPLRSVEDLSSLPRRMLLLLLLLLGRPSLSVMP